ncbi:MAG: hypothetical protein QNJ77_12955 [Acidimicrobiia bacterium]|nr:hypothetical protein [Acidimicrobiia bacterium]
MTTTIRTIGILFIVAGLVILVAPESVFSFLDWETRPAQFFAAALRVGLGVLILVAASSTRYRNGMRVLGSFAVLSGLAYAVMPNAGWTDLMRWLNEEGQDLYRFGGAAGGVLAGVFLIQASKPERLTIQRGLPTP